ncbi:Glutamate--cysteine ligase [Pantoea agglomerans]|uniref:Glutamate--cysteine ligase n=1 Tax=Enterobacter agglomerans TaxID=549 RepID=A0A379ACU7_ENTAG|nr:Glutamate--cysteine ligase [Pantoea agglomerans]
MKDKESGKETISAGYLRLIRNYYRFGWVIPYLFGASPAISSSFLQGRESALPFETNDKDNDVAAVRHLTASERFRLYQ